MQPEKPFLGTGWHFPPAFAKGGKDVLMVSDAEDIQQSLRILFSTQLGERVLQDTFGCDLNSFVFEEIDQSLINNMERMISDAILYHEPRIILDRLMISESPDQSGLLLINMDYTISGTNTRYNMVYPYYINEAVIPGFGS